MHKTYRAEVLKHNIVGATQVTPTIHHHLQINSITHPANRHGRFIIASAITKINGVSLAIEGYSAVTFAEPSAIIGLV